jgi:hypothetical protein
LAPNGTVLGTVRSDVTPARHRAKARATNASVWPHSRFAVRRPG